MADGRQFMWVECSQCRWVASHLAARILPTNRTTIPTGLSATGSFPRDAWRGTPARTVPVPHGTSSQLRTDAGCILQPTVHEWIWLQSLDADVIIAAYRYAGSNRHLEPLTGLHGDSKYEESRIHAYCCSGHGQGVTDNEHIIKCNAHGAVPTWPDVRRLNDVRTAITTSGDARCTNASDGARRPARAGLRGGYPNRKEGRHKQSG